MNRSLWNSNEDLPREYKKKLHQGNGWEAGSIRYAGIPEDRLAPQLNFIDSITLISFFLVPDPHINSISRTDSIKSLISKDLAPFKKYSELGRNISMMMSHIVYPSLDEKSLPASFSISVFCSCKYFNASAGAISSVDL